MQRLTNSASPSPGRRRKWLRLGAVLAAGAVGLVVFFGPVLNSRFDLLLGELGDTRFVNAILENWWLALHARADWKSPPMFFPTTGTLAYSDVLFLYSPIYSLTRLVGLSPYYALAATVAGLLFIGYASTVWVLRRTFGLPLWIGLFGAGVYAFAGVRVAHYGHVQLFAALFIPILFGLMLKYASLLSSGRWGLAPGLALAAGIAGLLFTSFYVGFFVIFYALLVIACFIALRLLGEGAKLATPVDYRRVLVSLAIVGLAFSVALVPFILLYLPHFLEIGARPWGQVASTLPAPVDLINVGEGNFVWGDLIRRVVPPGRPYEWELSYGLPSALLLLFLSTTGALLGFRWLPMMAIRSEPIAPLLRPMAIAVIIAWLLMLNWHGHSVWRIVFAVVPGASAIRAVSRFQLVLYFAVVLVATFGLAALWKSARSRAAKIIVGLLCMILLTEQIQLHPSMYDAKAETARLGQIHPPPSFCKHFLLLPAQGEPRMWYVSNLDAVMIALRFGIPTVNGYSGDVPRGWAMQEPLSPGYIGAANDWISTRNIVAGLCTFDVTDGAWRRMVPSPVSELVGKNLITFEPRTLEEGLSLVRSGFYGLEPGGRWTNGLGAIKFLAPIEANHLRIESGWNRVGVPVRIVVDGRVRFSEILPNASTKIDLPLEGSVQVIEVDSPTFVPKLMGINEDPRQLGIAIKEIVLQ